MAGTVTTDQGGSGAIDERNGGVDDERLERLARYGFMSKGFVYVVVGLLAGRSAFGGSSEGASKSGAFDAIAEQPFGKVLLAATAIGLLAYAGHRLVLVYTGPDHDTSMPDWLARLSFFVRGLAYLGFSFLAAREVLGNGGGGSGSGGGGGGETVTETILNWPAGTWIVGAVGAGLIAVGIRQLVRAYQVNWRDKMDEMGMSYDERTWTHRLGQVGYAGRGIAYGLVGWFVLQGALTHDPQKGGGLDVALQEVRQTSVGTVALLAIAVMLVCYGVFSFQEGRHREF